MRLDSDLDAMVRQSARKFGVRHRDGFLAVERLASPEFPRQLLDEAAALGWLGSLAGDDLSPCSESDSSMLAALVEELSYHCPAFGARLLVHHFGRVCLAVANEPALTANHDADWFGLEATTGDSRVAPTLAIEPESGAACLSGAMRFVLGGDGASHWLGFARSGDSTRVLVVVRANASQVQPVATLGLRGLGVTEGRFSRVGPADFRVIGDERSAASIVERAYRFIAPGSVGLILALLERTRQISFEHAATRRQNGTTLDVIPAVRQKLNNIRSALALARATQAALQEQLANAELLLAELARRALEATDDGLQVLGGAGYIVGHGLEQLWRDVRQVRHLLPRESAAGDLVTAECRHRSEDEYP